VKGEGRVHGVMGSGGEVSWKRAADGVRPALLITDRSLMGT